MWGLLLLVKVPKLVNYRVTIDLLMCGSPGLRKTTDWVELWRGTSYPLGLGDTIVNCSLWVILLRSRSIKSSLVIIILWLSLINHWTIIHESFFGDCGGVEAAGHWEELIDDRSRHDNRLLSSCFYLTAMVIVIVLTTWRAIMRIAFLDHWTIHFFLELIRYCLPWMIAVVMAFVNMNVGWKNFIVWY